MRIETVNTRVECQLNPEPINILAVKLNLDPSLAPCSILVELQGVTDEGYHVTIPMGGYIIPCGDFYMLYIDTTTCKIVPYYGTKPLEPSIFGWLGKIKIIKQDDNYIAIPKGQSYGGSNNELYRFETHIGNYCQYACLRDEFLGGKNNAT